MYQQRNDLSVFKQLSKIVWTPNNSLLYKNAAYAAMFNVNMPKCCDECGDYCCDSHHRDDLNAFSQAIVSALTTAVNAYSTGPPPPRKFPGLQTGIVKGALLLSHHVWIVPGKPQTGLISENCLACRTRYKKAIRAPRVVNKHKINVHGTL